ncbi:M16 family metallopeptidase [Anaplasma capra]|uniref:M16 family metallopeptidase n=1 Tax=Anaplasma capra TaxID=1562740 RepID=UPI0021D603A0|nr:pitrilysin family protein [Anaplasma capra]MCU7611749.1 insulinase family protein [Anaplasma capra]MCU7612500.1 insulinase family protein [Anaplasma capra]
MDNIPSVTKLENNFSIVSERVHGVNSVGISIWVRTGGRHEEKGKIGLAHFLEHMAFKGTTTRSALDIAMTFDRIGGNFNAYTDKEHTVYHVKVMKRDVGVAMEVLEDIVLRSAFPEIEIEREKNVVLQEIYQTNDVPSSIIFDKYMEVAYRDQIFGAPILGSEQSVLGFSKADLVQYMDVNYYGNNMILSVAGDIRHEEIVHMSEGFSQIKDRERHPVTPPTYTGGQYLEDRDLDQVNIVIGFPGVSYLDERYYVMQVLDSILGSSMSSRLFQEIREKRGLVYSISSFNSSYSDSGLFSIHAATDESKLRELLETIASEMKKLPETVQEEELLRAKSKLESEVLMSRESTVGKSEAIGYCYAHYNRYITKDEMIRKIRAVSLDDVVSAANLLLKDSNRLTVAAIGKIGSLPSPEAISNMLA